MKPTDPGLNSVWHAAYITATGCGAWPVGDKEVCRVCTARHICLAVHGALQDPICGVAAGIKEPFEGTVHEVEPWGSMNSDYSLNVTIVRAVMLLAPAGKDLKKGQRILIVPEQP